MANKLSMVFNCVVISLVLAVCLFYVPEAYCTDELYREETMGVYNSETYFIKENQEYILYSAGIPIMSIPYIPEELSSIPIIQEEGLE